MPHQGFCKAVSGGILSYLLQKKIVNEAQESENVSEKEKVSRRQWKDSSRIVEKDESRKTRRKENYELGSVFGHNG